MDQMDKENNLYGICSFCLFVIILAESQNDFAHLESRGCKNLNITHLDLLCFRVEDTQLSRVYHGCGSIDAQDGTGIKEVVAADADSVEIYSISEDNWRMGEYFNC